MFLASHLKLHFSQFCFMFAIFFGVGLHLPLDFSITEFNSYFFMLCKLKFQCLRFYFIYLSCFIQYFFEFIPFSLPEYYCSFLSRELSMLMGNYFARMIFIFDHFFFLFLNLFIFLFLLYRFSLCTKIFFNFLAVLAFVCVRCPLTGNP